MLNTQEFLQILNNYSDFAILISLGVSILIALSGVIPSVFVTGANILFFGVWPGFCISLLGEVIGAYITFYLYRYGFKSKVDNFAEKYTLLKRIIDSEGAQGGFLIFQGRLIPFIPSGFVTLAGAVSKISIVPFIIGTFLGKIPSIALECLVSYGVLSTGAKYIKLIITIIAIYLVYLTIKKGNKDEK